MRDSISGQRETAATRHVGYPFEKLRLVAIVENLGTRGPKSKQADVGQIRVNHGQTVRITIVERLEHHPVDHAEDGGTRTDAESQREYGDRGEAGIFPELAKGESEII